MRLKVIRKVNSVENEKRVTISMIKGISPCGVCRFTIENPKF